MENLSIYTPGLTYANIIVETILTWKRQKQSKAYCVFSTGGREIQMTKQRLVLVAAAIIFVFTFSGCADKLQPPQSGNTQSKGGQNLESVSESGTKKTQAESSKPDETSIPSGETQDNTSSSESIQAIDYEEVQPDESGKIMVVMFHNFVEEFSPTKYDDGQFTTTFDAFEELLGNLYSEGYRLISMYDYLNGNIRVPAGFIPMVFTFDDGTSGQFNLIDTDSGLDVNPRSAVGIMMKFNEEHPDFGLKGTFYVNLGNNMFSGKGELTERLKYLIDKGFEIGNHTFTHFQLNTAQNADAIIKEVGKNQKRMYELIPDYKMFSLSLPYGIPSSELFEHVISGVYEGVEYENNGIFEVGWCPALPKYSPDFNASSINRVRSPGINPVDYDLSWWISNMSRKEQYVSDGDPDTVVIPESSRDRIDEACIDGKRLIIY
jgi:hypothetical protein